MNIDEAARALRARRISSLELAQESLKRIREAQPQFNAFITITEERAFEQARRADEELARGLDRGALHGIPYALKDIFATRGIPTTCGAKLFAGRITDYDSEAYTKLTAAGAVLMGKTGMHELAYGITSTNPHFGAIRNPHDPERIPGGSSGGSGVAVAADLVFFAMGTDTGGSIRVPASYCGCVGFKPTYGRVSRAGVFPLGLTLDHVGPMTRSVRDTQLVMKVIAGMDIAPARSPATLRIGVPENFFTERLDSDVASAFGQAIRKAESLGAIIVPVTVPDPLEINAIGRLILLCEAAALFRPWLDRREEFGADVLALVDQGLQVPAADYVDAQRRRRQFRKQWLGLRDRVDVIFTPTTPICAPLIGQTEVDGEDVRVASTRFVRPFNVLGFPALSMPLTGRNLPVGLQIAGMKLADDELLASIPDCFD